MILGTSNFYRIKRDLNSKRISFVVEM